LVDPFCLTLHLIGDGQSMNESSPFDDRHKPNERGEFSAVRGFERVDVARPIVPRHHQWEPTGSNEHERGDRSRHSTVTVLKRVDLGEPVVKPSSLNIGRNPLVEVFLVHFHETIHL
jgi:hypothetical protein